MYPTILDTKTGQTETFQSDDGFEFSVFWWTEGNGSCDCNREFGTADEEDDDLTPEEIEAWPHICRRRRFVAIDVGGNLEGYGKAEIPQMMNQKYPEYIRAIAEEQYAI